MRRRILFLSRWCPLPATNGIKIRNRYLLHALSQQFEVDLITFVDHPFDAQLAQEIQQRLNVNIVRLVAWEPSFNAKRGWSRLLSLEPTSVGATYSAEMAAEVDRLAAEHRYDLLIASMVDMAPYALRIHNTPRLLEDLEVYALYDQLSMSGSPLQIARRRLMWQKWQRYLKRLLPSFAAVTTVSKKEQRLLAHLNPDYTNIHVIDNGVDSRLLHPLGGEVMPNSVIYAGSVTYSANYDAVDYFASEIAPLVQLEIPALQTTVTGSTNGVEIAKLSTAGITFSGFVDDLPTLVAGHWASVVPLRHGSGTRLKILESLALGTPVVTTSKGVEGLRLQHDEHVLIADTPQAFADQCVRLLSSSDLRQNLSERGRRYVAKQYDWDGIGRTFVDIANSLTLDVIKEKQPKRQQL